MARGRRLGCYFCDICIRLFFSFAKKKEGKNKTSRQPPASSAATLTRVYFCRVTTCDYGAAYFRALCSPQGSWRSSRDPRPTRSRTTARSSSCAASRAPRQVSQFRALVCAAALEFKRREGKKQLSLLGPHPGFLIIHRNQVQRQPFLYLNRILCNHLQ